MFPEIKMAPFFGPSSVPIHFSLRFAKIPLELVEFLVLAHRNLRFPVHFPNRIILYCSRYFVAAMFGFFFLGWERERERIWILDWSSIVVPLNVFFFLFLFFWFFLFSFNFVLKKKNDIVSRVLIVATNWVVTKSCMHKNWKLEDWINKTES